MEILRHLEHAARSGAETALRHRQSIRIVTDKGFGDFATQADLDSQSTILEHLSLTCAGIPVIAEEDETLSGELPESFLTVDPLDGTIIFSRGCPEWGVLLSYVERGTPVAGVMVQPELDRMVSFESGQPPLLKDCAGEVLREISLGGTEPERLVLGIDINMFTRPRDLQPILDGLIGSDQVLLGRAPGASIAGTADLLLGAIDAYINPRGGKIWDFAPCAGAVREAGGVALEFTDDRRTLREFCGNKLHYGVAFCRSLAVAERLARAFA